MPASTSAPLGAALADIRRIAQVGATIAAAIVAIGASLLPAEAQASHMLVIPASDGYGFDDCLAGAKACGQTIADAWCEAHGMAAAASFGRADDVTASLADPKVAAIQNAGARTAGVKVDPGSFIVNCRD